MTQKCNGGKFEGDSWDFRSSTRHFRRGPNIKVRLMVTERCQDFPLSEEVVHTWAGVGGGRVSNAKFPLPPEKKIPP